MKARSRTRRSTAVLAAAVLAAGLATPVNGSTPATPAPSAAAQTPFATETSADIVLRDGAVEVRVDKAGFRYSIARDGRVLAPAHQESGLLLGSDQAADTTLVSSSGNTARLAVTTDAGTSVQVDLAMDRGTVKMTVDEVPDSLSIDFRTGGVAPAYGLGDYGSHSDSSVDEGTPCGGKVEARDDIELTGVRFDNMSNQGSCKRFISNFTVFPQQRLAQVLFAEESKRVELSETENRLGVNRTDRVDSLYYFTGPTLKDIYRTYATTRTAEGYPDVQPRQTLFELGWESYGALTWNTVQEPVDDTVQAFADHGYDLKWGIVGSGFWPGPRGNGTEGTTTSFGMWDDTCDYDPADGSYPDMACPRYPDPDGMKQHFADLGMKMLLGLRNNMKAVGQSEFYNEQYDGTFAVEALERGYFLTDKAGELVTVDRTGYPKGPSYVLDADNPEAVRWFVEKSRLWGVDGFKEDAMLYEPVFNRDGIWNPLLMALHQAGDDVMVRNAAYSVPGDVLRANDTYYGTGEAYESDPDRLPINMLNFAASGAPNVYGDYVGGTPTAGSLNDPAYQDYFVRNAWILSVSPSMSMGRGPWEMDDPNLAGDKGEQYASSTLKAAKFHDRMVPYIYDAAVDSHRTGYPSTMTPLPIAFPDDANTYHLAADRQYEWMIGDSLLAAPLFGADFATAHSRDVYLPAGSWIDYETGARFSGNQTLKNYPLGTDRVPAFVGGDGILVERDGDTLQAKVFPVGDRRTEYVMDGQDDPLSIRLNNTGWDPARLRVVDRTDDRQIPFTIDDVTGAVIFPVATGHRYQLVAGGRATDTISRPSGSGQVTGVQHSVDADGQLHLQWSAVEGASSYRIAVDGACGQANTIDAGANTDTSLLLGRQPLAAGTYRVTAWSSTGASEPSEPHQVERVFPEPEGPVTVTDEGQPVTCDPGQPPYAEVTGTWKASSIKGSDGSRSRYSGSADATATWSAALPAGSYQVEAWIPDFTGTTAASYQVLGTATPAEPVVLDQRENLGTWQSLGTYEFVAGEQLSAVRVTRSGTGNLRTDAVRFTPAE